MASSSTPPPPAEEPEPRNWAELPRDVTTMILKKVGVINVLQSAQKVCMAWRSVSKDPATWRSIDMRNLGDHAMDYNVEKIAKYAIDRSCGQLLEFSLCGFGSDELLRYISERASQLRHLQLVYPYRISDEGLSEAAKKLPLLEELHIYSGFFLDLSKESLLNVGRSCPHLKSLKFDNQRLWAMEFDDEALAIAETMPGLHNLQLFGNSLTDDGLKAILDGCPNLEFLDLRCCFNVNLGGSLGRRCSEQIKLFRQPHDSIDDYMASLMPTNLPSAYRLKKALEESYSFLQSVIAGDWQQSSGLKANLITCKEQSKEDVDGVFPGDLQETAGPTATLVIREEQDKDYIAEHEEKCSSNLTTSNAEVKNHHAPSPPPDEDINLKRRRCSTPADIMYATLRDPFPSTCSSPDDEFLLPLVNSESPKNSTLDSHNETPLGAVEGMNAFPHEKVCVYPRKPNMTFPEGATVLPSSSD